ncbi:hypothetical protein [Nostoc sp.]|uniref:hypothetical protein n=1 Tax=Nostoc sp. TaxID=1180 RepID=UPI002FF90237
MDQKSNSFIVYIRHEALASSEEIILDYLDKHEKIIVGTIKSICHFKSDYDYKKTIKGLVTRGLISHLPNAKGKNSAYHKVKTLS